MGFLLLLALAAPTLVAAYGVARARCRLAVLDALLGAATLAWAWIVVEFWALSCVDGVTRTGHAAATAAAVLAGVALGGPSRIGRRLREMGRLLRVLAPGGARLTPARAVTWLAAAWAAWALARLILLPSLNGDSLSYHLARVAHWIENGSLAAYPTAIERQIASPVNAELLVLYHILPAGVDTLCELPQLESFALILLAGLAIARRLGARGGACALGGALLLTMPLVLVQSYTTQTDLVFAAAACLALYWAMRAAEGGPALLCVLAAALLAGTKPHGLVVAALLALLAAWDAARGRSKILRAALCALPVLAVLAGPVYLRNRVLYGAWVYHGSGASELVVPGWETFGANLVQSAERLWRESAHYGGRHAFDHNSSHFGLPFGVLLAGACVWSAARTRRREGAAGPVGGGGARTLLVPIVGSLLVLWMAHVPVKYTLRWFLYVPAALAPWLAAVVSRAGGRGPRVLRAAVAVAAAVTMGLAVARDRDAGRGIREGIARGTPTLTSAEFLPRLSPDCAVFAELDRRARPGDVVLVSLGEYSLEYPAHGGAFDRRVIHLRSPGAVPPPAPPGGSAVWLLADMEASPPPWPWIEPAYEAREVAGTTIKLWELTPREER